MVKSENNFFTQGNVDNFRRPFFLLYDSFRVYIIYMVYTYIFSHITVWYEQPMLYTVPRGRSKWSIKKHVVFLTVPPVLLEEKNRTSMSHPKAQYGPSQRQGLSCWQGQAQSRYRPLSTCLHGPSQPATSAEQPGPDAGRDEIRPCLLLCCLPAGLVVPSRSRANLSLWAADAWGSHRGRAEAARGAVSRACRLVARRFSCALAHRAQARSAGAPFERDTTRGGSWYGEITGRLVAARGSWEWIGWLDRLAPPWGELVGGQVTLSVSAMASKPLLVAHRPRAREEAGRETGRAIKREGIEAARK